jgi:uncharacterized protein (TIGR03118 family)
MSRINRISEISIVVTVLVAGRAALGAYAQTNLTSDGFVSAANTDSNLKNPWGMAFNPTGGPFWISDQVTGVATVYDGGGAPFPAGSPLIVSIPSNAGTDVGPTGQVFNSSSDFALSSGGKSGPAVFLFANLDGSISAWNPTGTLTQSVKVASGSSGAVYTGLAIANNGSGNFLLAANNASGKIDVFDKNFAPATLSGTFTDPDVPANLHPFNVQNLNGKIYVTYAVPGEEADAVDVGSGAVSVFDTNGNLLQHLISGGQLASPWGVAIAPASGFGEFNGALLVGNFNDEHGVINAFDANTGSFLGTISDTNGSPIENDDLWAIAFGNGTTGSDTHKLYLTAGLGDEEHGLFASISPAASAIPLPPALLSAPLAIAAGFASMRRRRKD